MLVKIKRIAATTANVTQNQIYTVLSFDGLGSGPTASSGNGAGYALIVDDTGKLFVTGNILDLSVHDWDFVSASYVGCVSV